MHKTINTIKIFALWALAGATLFPSAIEAQTCSISAKLDDRTISIEAVSDNAIKVTNAAIGQPTLSQFSNNFSSTSSVYPLGDNIQTLVTASGLSATVNKKTGEVVINGGSANKIIADNSARISKSGEQILKLYTTSTGSYYGAGERGHSINLRGDTLVMYNRQNYGYGKGDERINQMNITMPLFISSDGFAILFDDFAAAKMYLGNDSEIEYATESPNAISYYYINGANSIADVVTELSGITGRQPLPPLWSLGYITSKYGYHNEKETVGAIDTLKRQGYPVDGIVLDLYWYGKEEDMGRLDWEKSQWPNPKKMLSKLKNENVNLIAISQPYILRNGKGIENYNYLAENGMLLADSTGKNPQEVKIWVGEGGMFDVSNPSTRAWLANRYKELTDMGITGWWGDLGEPEVHPESGLHANGLPTRLYHNKYGNDWSKIVYDMFQENYPDTRLVTMMRGGTTGLQKYSVFPWSTDVARSWEGMQPQVTIMLNSGLSGLGYMGHDVGGFAIDKENPIDSELYVRWLQLGLFSPMLRTHAQAYAEPYHYPEYADIILPLVKERYRWLPYNYTLAYENAVYGFPLVRPLNFYELGDSKFDSIDDEYLWGSEVLVAPVMQQGAKSRKITFPTGNWIDYNNPSNHFLGNTEIIYDAPLNILPLFVRAGAFIPTADYDMKSTADYKSSKFTINYYPLPGTESEYTLYDDNKLSASSIATGQFRLINFKGQVDENGNIKIKVTSEGTYANAPKSVSLTFDIKGQEKTTPKVNISEGKLKINSDWNFTVDYVPGTELTLEISK